MNLRYAMVLKLNNRKGNNMKINLQEYAEFPVAKPVNKAVAGKDILLAVYNSDATKLFAVSGQQGLTINRTADSIEITSKDTEGGWKSKIAGMKEWSIDNDGIYVLSDESHSELSKAYENSDPVCIKIINNKAKKGMFAGFAVITDYSLEAPYDDSMTYSISLEGMGALVDLSVKPVTPDTMPQGPMNLENLTIVSVASTSTSGKTSIYINPIKHGENKYKYKSGERVEYPVANEDCTSMTDWNGTDELQIATGQKLLIVECDNKNKAKKAGIVTVTSKA